MIRLMISLPKEWIKNGVSFQGEAPASDPLKKNQEIVLNQKIENIVRPSTSDSYMRSACVSCRGRAETIIH